MMAIYFSLQSSNINPPTLLTFLPTFSFIFWYVINWASFLLVCLLCILDVAVLFLCYVHCQWTLCFPSVLSKLYAESTSIIGGRGFRTSRRNDSRIFETTRHSTGNDVGWQESRHSVQFLS